VTERQRYRIMVRDRGVAELPPIEQPRKRRWVPREQIERIIRNTPPDADFARDIDAMVGATIDELDLDERTER
jgi:antitoxin (DNA-binding transcriptional repressor) of toxin-antitoxin stability system